MKLSEKIVSGLLLTAVFMVLIGSRLFAPAGVYVRSCTMDSLDVVSSAVEISRTVSLGFIYPDTTTMNTSSLQFDVSHDNSTWVTWTDTAGDSVQVVNKVTGGFVSLTGLGGLAIPGYIRVRLGASTDVCRVDDKTFYFVIRQGG